jgi:peptidoglycan/xylan/chitin deacetylase (PgdA/CDA1 family)
MLTDYVRRNYAKFVSFAEFNPTQNSRSDLALALTFDDGFKSNINIGRALADLGLSACFYVPTDVIGLSKCESDAFFGRPQAEGVMSWHDLEELTDMGHVVGSHCRQHIALKSLGREEAEDQVKGSLEVLKSRLGRADHFAWPFGSLNHVRVDEVISWCAQVGATPASGVRGANNPSRFTSEGYLRRDAITLSRINRDLAVFAFYDAIRGGS